MVIIIFYGATCYFISTITWGNIFLVFHNDMGTIIFLAFHKKRKILLAHILLMSKLQLRKVRSQPLSIRAGIQGR